MKENEYQCSMCAGVFEKGWSDDAAMLEAQHYFGKHPTEWKGGMAVTCDDCFKKIHPADHPDAVARTKQNI